MARGWEAMDIGYASYLSMAVMEHTAQNPIVLTFVDLLCSPHRVFVREEWRARPAKTPAPHPDSLNEQLLPMSSLNSGLNSGPNSASGSSDSYASSLTLTLQPTPRARIRWHLALTLHNNPALCIYRKHSIAAMSHYTS